MSVAIIGECMLELTHSNLANTERSRTMHMSFGGDTLNTAIYLSRNDVDVNYVTGLGDDVMSDWLVEQWESEGIDCSLVTRMPNSVPGMYMINVADDGERSFLYWRDSSPASRLFDDAERIAELAQALKKFSHIYLSGISLAILSDPSRARFIELLTDYRKSGGRLIFDGNYRPNLWPNSAVAQQAYTQMYQITDIALPTLEDEEMLFGFDTAEQVLQAISGHGVPEIVVKMGGEGCLAFYNDGSEYVSANPTTPVDTTAAGDSFNAGYLSARLHGYDVRDACIAGHELASKVIQHRGAIIPATPAAN